MMRASRCLMILAPLCGIILLLPLLADGAQWLRWAGQDAPATAQAGLLARRLSEQDTSTSMYNQPLSEILDHERESRTVPSKRALGGTAYGIPLPSGHYAARYRPSGSRNAVAPQMRQSEEAYATLLYSDGFLLGVRVLGQSIRESGTNRDMVALLTESVSPTAEATLRGDGWIIKRIALIANPGKRPEGGFPKFLFGAYSKLMMWDLVEYQKVIYLDADTIVVRNLDHLFRCPNLCVVMRHSERFNSGVMALRPDRAVLTDMLAKISSTPSYTGGDQGFLNVYFSDFLESPMFDPNMNNEQLKGHRVMRMHTGYNADMGLAATNGNKFKMAEDAVHVLHYTLGPFKPWDYWTPYLITPSVIWVAFRENLPLNPAGHPRGEGFIDTFARWVLVPTPFLLAFWGTRCASRAQAGQLKYRKRPPVAGGRGQPGGVAWVVRALVEPLHEPRGGWMGTLYMQASAVATCGLATGAAAFAVKNLVPNTLMPSLGMFLAWEWLSLATCSTVGGYLYVMYRLGLRCTRVDKEMSAPLLVGRHPYLPTLFGALATTTMAGLSVAASPMLGVDGLIPRCILLVTLLGCTLSTLVIVTTYLAPRWFFAGRLDALERTQAGLWAVGIPEHSSGKGVGMGPTSNGASGVSHPAGVAETQPLVASGGRRGLGP